MARMFDELWFSDLAVSREDPNFAVRKTTSRLRILVPLSRLATSIIFSPHSPFCIDGDCSCARRESAKIRPPLHSDRSREKPSGWKESECSTGNISRPCFDHCATAGRAMPSAHPLSARRRAKASWVSRPVWASAPRSARRANGCRPAVFAGRTGRKGPF